MPAVMSLVALSDVREHLGIDPNDASDDAELAGFIDAATAFVQFQTGPIIGQTFTETHDGGSPYIYVDNPPIYSVTTVVERVGVTFNTLTPVTFGQTGSGTYGYVVENAKTGRLTRLWNGMPGAFIGGQRNVQIVYDAGLSDVAGDVRMAVLEDIRGLWQQTQQGGGRPAFGSSSGTAEGDTWSVGPMNLFPRLASLLSGPSRTPSVG